MIYPMTLSGYGLVVPITDQDALAVQPGETLIVRSPNGLQPLVVTEQRWGVTEDSEKLPFEVPVLDGQIYGGPVMTYAIPDCYQVIILQL